MSGGKFSSDKFDITPEFSKDGEYIPTNSIVGMMVYAQLPEGEVIGRLYLNKHGVLVAVTEKNQYTIGKDGKVMLMELPHD